MSRLLIALFFLLVAAPAFADDCGGTLVGVKNVYSNQSNPTKIGELQVYWNASNGKNCARFAHAGRTWGVARITGVSLGICRNRQDRLCNRPDNDRNADPSKFVFEVKPGFKFYAGPVRLSARGHCIRAAGYIRDLGQDRKAVLYGFCD